MPGSRLEAARQRITNKYWAGTMEPLAAQWVCFQPKDTECQDRVAVEQWDIAGDRWLFAAVFDGMFTVHPEHSCVDISLTHATL